MVKVFSILLVLITIIIPVFAQNTGIGTHQPEARLHVNGDLKLQAGASISKFSRDSLFTENSHQNVPTEKAISDYLKKGYWTGANLSTPGPQAPFARSFAVMEADEAAAIASKDDLVFVLSLNSNSLSAFDISDPDNLVRRGSISTHLSQPGSIFIQGNYAYVTSIANNRLCIFDISNPDNIIARGFTSTSLVMPRKLVVQGNYAYVACDDPGRISVFDISNPDNIVFRTTGGVGLSSSIALDVQGNYLYATSFSASELQVYDISNPDALVYRSFSNTNLNGPVNVDVAGNYAYVVSRLNNRLCIFDISNPNSIVAKGSTTINLLEPTAVKVKGNYAFVASYGNARLCMFDVTNPQAILNKGYSSAFLQQVTDLCIPGNYIAVTNRGGNRNVCIYDLDFARNVQIGIDGVRPVNDTWKNSGNNIFRNTGNVGIRKQFPSEALDVVGNIAATGALLCGQVITPRMESTYAFTTDMTLANLNFQNTLGNKITFYNNGTGHAGVGIYNFEYRFHTDLVQADITFGVFNNGNFTERVRIKGNGNVGIGTNNPSTPLSFPAVLGKKISLYPGTTGDVGLAVEGNDFRLYTDHAGAKVSIGYSQYTSNFYQNNLDIYANGSAWLRGTLTQASDLRLKTNINRLQNVLPSILQLNGYHYQWIDSTSDQSLQTGVIAQEVQRLFPELVKQNEKGELSVNYTGLIPVLVESVKELKSDYEQKLQVQEQRIKALEEMVRQLLRDQKN